MAQQPRQQKFWVSISFLVMYTLMFAVFPFLHGANDPTRLPALVLNVDVVYGFLSMLGIGTIVAIVSLHRRIKALEKKSASEKTEND